MSKRYEKMRLPGVKVTVSIAGYYIAKVVHNIQLGQDFYNVLLKTVLL